MKIEEIFSKSVLEKPDTKRAIRMKNTIDFSSLVRMGWNENPYGMAPNVAKAHEDAAKISHFYEDFWNKDMTEAIAKHYGISTDNVIVGAGSSPLIEIIGQVFINPGDEVIMCPTYAAFNDMVEVRRGKIVMVPLRDDMKFDLDGIAAAVTDRTKMVVICNPNNPTGGYVGYEEIKAFLNKLPKNIVVFFDEAYMEFATADDCRSAMPLIFEMPDRPILVMRTFSKYYAMAGVRAGYIIAGEELMPYISRIPGSWVSTCAQAAAAAAMGEEAAAYYADCKEKIIAGIAYLSKELAGMGCVVYPTQSNFIMFDPHRNPADVRMALIQKGVLISCPMFCRVTASTPENNEFFIKCMKEVMAELPEVNE